MSETVHYKGKLKAVWGLSDDGNDNDGSLEEAAVHLYGTRPELPYYYDSCSEWLEESEEYLIYNGFVYEINSVDFDPCDDIMTASENKNRSIDFEVKFYNGSCCMKEALETSIDKMNAKLAKSE